MENLRSDNVTMGGIGSPGYGGHGFGGGLESLILGAALTGGGLFGGNRGPSVINTGYQPALVEMSALINEKSNGDTRRDVADSTSEIRESIHNQTIANNSEARSILHAINHGEKESLAARYENQIATKDSTAALISKVDCETNSLRKQQFDTQVSMDKQFSLLSYQIEKGFNQLAQDELKRENSNLRQQNEFLRDRNQDDELFHRLARLIRNDNNTPNP